jgi:hypothetical protein
MFLLIGCNMQGKNRNVSARSPYSRLRSEKIDSQFRFFLFQPAKPLQQEPARRFLLRESGTNPPEPMFDAPGLDQLNL